MFDRWLLVGKSCVPFILTAVFIVGALAVVGAEPAMAQVQAFPNTPDTQITIHTLRQRAKPDECFAYLASPAPLPPFTDPNDCGRYNTNPPAKPKVNQAYIWGAGETSDSIWFGTFANGNCVTQAGSTPQNAQHPNGAPSAYITDSWVCEYYDSPYYPTIFPNALIGDARTPRIQQYNKTTHAIVDKTPVYPNFVDPIKNPEGIFPLLIQMRGIRAGTVYNNIVILAGPNLSPSNGIAFFGWNATTGEFLGGIKVLGFNNIRQFLNLNGVLYSGVGTNDSGGKVTGGAIVRLNPTVVPGCIFNAGNPNSPCWLINGGTPMGQVPPTIVGSLASVSGTLTKHNGRIFTATWPSQDIPGNLSTLYMSPLVPAGGLDASHATQWTALWKASDYEPDPGIAQSYAGGAIASFDGYLWWGTLHIPMSTMQRLVQAYPPATQDEALQDLAGTFRAAAFFRIKDPDTNPQIDIVYGNYELPVFTPPPSGTGPGTWTLKVNNMNKRSLWGTSGFGNMWNTYAWSATVWNNRLWVGTMDWSFLAQQGTVMIADTSGSTLPPQLFANASFGSDLFYFTSASKPAFPESTNGVDNPMTFGVRNQISSMNGNLFLGMANAMNLLTDPADPKHFGGLGGWELNELALSPNLNTPAGTNVPVNLPNGVSITYCSVTTPGTTFSATVNNPYNAKATFHKLLGPYDLNGPDLPAGISGQPSRVSLLWSSALWGQGCNSTGLANVAVPITGVLAPRLLQLQWDGAQLAWKDITTSVDTAAGKIYGSITGDYLGLLAVAPEGPTVVKTTTITPNTGRQGQTLFVSFKGQYTTFAPQTTTVNFGSGITVNSFSVTSPTSATASITIAAAATLGSRDVTVTTGSEAVTVANGFTVNGIPGLSAVHPTSGVQGQTLSVNLTSQWTSFSPGITTASFGAGITVNSVAVSGATTATANITIATDASPGGRTVSVSTGTETVIANNAFTVTAPAPPPPDTPPAPPVPAPSPLMVTMTAPANGATVSGTAVVVSANAFNGVAGVQFQIDGRNLGAEDINEPFSISWDTTAVANGSHSLTAVARDGSGRQATSMVAVFVQNTIPTISYTIPVDGGVPLTVADSNAPTTTVSHARLEQSSSSQQNMTANDPTAASGIAGLAIIALRTNEGLVSETGVPASPEILSGRIFAEIGGAVNTGLALSNTSSQTAQITFYFTNQNGVDSTPATITLAANHQIVAFLNQAPFNGPANLQGTFTFQSSTAVGAIALRGLTNERGEFLISTLPVASRNIERGTILPHFSDGGGWTTQIVLVNTSDSVQSGKVQFFGQGSSTEGAQLLELTVNDATGSSFDYSLPPHSETRLVTAGSSETVQVGSVRISPNFSFSGVDGIPQAFAIFSYRENGITVSEASVAAQPTGTAFRMYLESSGTAGQEGSIQSGVAIANTSQEPVTVSVDLTSLNGISTGLSSATITVPAGGQISKFINELFPGLPANFQGIGKVRASSNIAIAGLRGRYNERREFLITTTPPANDGVTGPAALVFPHIASGNGYSTQIVVYGQPGGGRLFLRTQDGSEQPSSSLIGQQ